MAAAADLPAEKGPPVYTPPPVAEFNWTGFYGGVNGGFGFDYFPLRSTVVFPSGAAVTAYSGLDLRGALFGGQIGYNYEFTNVPWIGHAVVGIEADSDWADIADSTQINTALGSMAFGTAVRNFGSVRGRVGYNFDRLLLYLTGGFSYATRQNFLTVGGASVSDSTTYFPTHPSIFGAGLEYALTDNVTIRGEYLYDYIRANYPTYALPDGTTAAYTTRATFHIFRVGLNYKFNLFEPTAPVIAKY